MAPDLVSLEDVALAPFWLARLHDDLALTLYIRLQEHGARRRYVRPPVAQLARETAHARGTIYHALRRLVSYGAIRERIRPNGLAEWFCLVDVQARPDIDRGVAS